MYSRFCGLAGAVLALLAASPAYATDEDTQLWAVLSATVPLSDTASAQFELSPRLRDGPDQVLTRGSVDFVIAEGLTVAGGAAYVEFAGGNEFRPHQQVAYTTGPLTLRTRLEERFFEDGDRAQLRLRQQARLAFPLDPKTQISGGAEVLYIVQSEVPGGDKRVDQWRAEIAMRRRLSGHFDAALTYRAILSPRGPLEDRLSHVPIVTLAWRP
jgi:hypothetical protein